MDPSFIFITSASGSCGFTHSRHWTSSSRACDPCAEPAAVVVRIRTRFTQPVAAQSPCQALAGVATHDGHRRVGASDIDADGLTLQHSTPRYFRQHEGEHRLMREAVSITAARHRHVIPFCFAQSVVQKGGGARLWAVDPPPKRIPRFARDAFKNQFRQPEIHPQGTSTGDASARVGRTGIVLRRRVEQLRSACVQLS